MIILIFCSDSIKEETQTISRFFLENTPNESQYPMDIINWARFTAVCQLQSSFKNSCKYESNSELCRKAEKEISAL